MPSIRPLLMIRSSQLVFVGRTRESTRSYPRAVRPSARCPSMVIKNGSEKFWPISWPRGRTTPIESVRFSRRFRASSLGLKSYSLASSMMRSRVFLFTRLLPASALDAVAVETPASSARSEILLSFVLVIIVSIAHCRLCATHIAPVWISQFSTNRRWL